MPAGHGKQDASCVDVHGERPRPAPQLEMLLQGEQALSSVPVADHVEDEQLTHCESSSSEHACKCCPAGHELISSHTHAWSEPVWPSEAQQPVHDDAPEGQQSKVALPCARVSVAASSRSAAKRATSCILEMQTTAKRRSC